MNLTSRSPSQLAQSQRPAGCPRCNGYIEYGRDHWGEWWSCIFCGWLKEVMASPPPKRRQQSRGAFHGFGERRVKL